MKAKQEKDNNPFQITGNWTDQSKQLKAQYSQLTDQDLKFETGKESELLGRIETKLNKNREEVINILKEDQPAQVTPKAK